MLNKLAYRNVKRSAKDYRIYFLTMAIVAAFMFAFNTLLFSKDVRDAFQISGIMMVMLGLATFFIVLIVAWLIHYMARFILEKRGREFGIYLLLGMKKKEIARLYIRESMLLGAGAFVAGLVFGLLLQQILLAIFYHMVQMDYYLHLELDKSCLLMTVSCYGGCYLFAMLRCRWRFRKMNIRELMDSQKKNEEIKESHEQAKRLLVPVAAAFFLIFGLFLFGNKSWNEVTLAVFLTGLVLTIYLLYGGISAWIICYVRNKKNAVYRKDNLFLLRQFSSKVRAMSFTMGTLTALFTLAVLGSAVALMFNHFQNQMLAGKFPFDVQVYSERADDDFKREIQILEKETRLKEAFTYQIYENHTNQVNVWLYTHLSVFGDDYLKPDGTPDLEEIGKNEEMVYCDYDTYIGLSDYNHLRRMINLPEISIKDGEYAVHIKERVLNETGDFFPNFQINGADGELKFAGYHTECFSQDGQNGGDYIIVVPDRDIKAMRPYYAELTADIRGKAPANLKMLLDNDRRLANVQGYGQTRETDGWQGDDENDFDYEDDFGNSCSGSDSIVVYAEKNLVRDNLIPEIKYMLLSVIFPLFYVGIVFLCVALTVLSVQQLSDAAKYRFRYQVLFQIGCSGREITKIIFKQLFGYYLCPAMISFLISAPVAVFAGSRFNFYTGAHVSAAFYFLCSAGVFLGIYAVYFMTAFVGFCRNVGSGIMIK